jgi:hypothetical protein
MKSISTIPGSSFSLKFAIRILFLLLFFFPLWLATLSVEVRADSSFVGMNMPLATHHIQGNQTPWLFWFSPLQLKISGDGIIAASVLDRAGLSDPDYLASIHSDGEGSFTLPHPNGNYLRSWITDISYDGSVIVGLAVASNYGDGIRWTNGVPTILSGLDNSGLYPGGSPVAVSGNGRSVVGSSFICTEYYPPPNSSNCKTSEQKISLWPDTSIKPQALPNLPGFPYHSPIDISFDGNVILAQSANCLSLTCADVFYLIKNNSIYTLPNGPAAPFNYRYSALSSNGKIAVGSGRLPGLPSSKTNEGFYWSEASGIQSLNSTSDFYTVYPYAVSADGSVIGGMGDVYGPNNTAGGLVPFLWDKENGFRRLRDVLIEHGLYFQIYSWTLVSVLSISDDGKTIVGSAIRYAEDGVTIIWDTFKVKFDPEGKVIWSNGAPIEGAKVQAYALRRQNNESFVDPIPYQDGVPVLSDKEGKFRPPKEINFTVVPRLSDEIGISRGLMATIEYDEITSTTKKHTVTNYPRWDPLYPENNKTIGLETIKFPNPVVFQPGVFGKVDAPANGALSGGSAGIFRDFLLWDSGKKPSESPASGQSWSLIKRGGVDKQQIPSFLFFGVPSANLCFLSIFGYCADFLTDRASPGYDSSPWQSPERLEKNAEILQAHLEAKINPQIDRFTPGGLANVPLNLTGHSLGGIITRRWFFLEDRYPLVSNYVTFDAVHGGTYIGFFSNLFNEAMINGWTKTANSAPQKICDPLDRDMAECQGWNYSFPIPTSTSNLLFSAPDDDIIGAMGAGLPIISPSESAFGIGRIMIKAPVVSPNFPSFTIGYGFVPNGFCERFIGGYEIPVPNANHSVQQDMRVVTSAAKFLANVNSPSLGSESDPGQLSAAGLQASFSGPILSGPIAPYCSPGESAPETQSNPEPSIATLSLLSENGAPLTMPIGGGLGSSVQISGYSSNNNADILVTNSGGQILTKNNLSTEPFGNEGTTFSFEVALGADGGTITLLPMGEPTYAKITLDFNDEIRATTSPENTAYQSGEVVTVVGLLSNSDFVPTVGTSGNATAYISAPNGTSYPINLFDDGLHNDGLASDGIFAGQFSNTGEGGWYHIQSTISTQLNSGANLTRTAENIFLVKQAGAYFQNTAITESVGIESYVIGQINVQIGVQVEIPGSYRVSAKLKLGDTFIEKLYSTKKVTNTPSTETYTLVIPSVIFFRLNNAGPLTLSEITLEDGSNNYALDTLPDYITGIYSLDTLLTPPVPRIWTAQPDFLNIEGGERITLHGDGFEFVSEGYWRGNKIDDLQVLNSSTIAVTSLPIDCAKGRFPDIKLVTPYSTFTSRNIISYNLGADCNSNENIDFCEIQTGKSADVDSNGQPDECQCNNNGICEFPENCNTCSSDCAKIRGGICGNGVCESAAGENCSNCSADCNGKQNGKTSNQFCCGNGGGKNPVSCSDSRCTSSGYQCINTAPVDSCCGDLTCNVGETSSSCNLDCRPTTGCGNGICESNETPCSCSSDCGAAPLTETSCTDGIDNNCNNLIDCADSSCNTHPSCVVSCGAKGSSCTSNTQCCSGNCKGKKGSQTCG